MLATARELHRSGAGYAWEWKHDGGRAIARVRADGQVRLDSRNAKDFTLAFPEVAQALAEALPGRRVTLGGEIIAPDPGTGVPDFGRLQERFGVCPSAELLARVPVSYVVFDLLHLDGQATTRLTYLERRRLLSELAIDHPRLPVPAPQLDADPAMVLQVAAQHGLEGVVGKRLDSTYRSGRSPAWLKHALLPDRGHRRRLDPRPRRPQPQPRRAAAGPTSQARHGRAGVHRRGRHRLDRCDPLPGCVSGSTSWPPTPARSARRYRASTPTTSAPSWWATWNTATAQGPPATSDIPARKGSGRTRPRTT
jgi:bifunctional non-homologous end joining protein LigD